MISQKKIRMRRKHAILIGILAVLVVGLAAYIAAVTPRVRMAMAQGDVRILAETVAEYSVHCGGPPPVGASTGTCATAPVEPASGDVPPALTMAQTNAQGKTAEPFIGKIPNAPAGWKPYRYAVGRGTFKVCTAKDGIVWSSHRSTTCP